MANAAVLMSGGVDSYACAHFIKKSGGKPMGIFVNYGQAAARRERAAFAKIATRLQIKSAEIRLQMNKSFGVGEIPGRNGLLVMSALAAAPKGATIIATGIHAGTPYYDCSAAFVDRMDEFIREYTQGASRLFAPFISWSKADVFKYCRGESLDLTIAYSCERGGPPCGKCHSCLDRVANDAR